MRGLTRLTLSLCLVGLLAGCSSGGTPEANAAPPERLRDPDLDECSGFARSSVHEGVLWSHNDSGGEPILYAVGLRGERRGRVRVEGAKNVDWEDITFDDRGNLWVHDGGNNRNNRKDLTLYRVPEPGALDGTVKADRVVRFHFPEQREFPPTRAERNFDSEAVFWDKGQLFLLTKHRGNTKTTLYRFPQGFEDDPRWSRAEPEGSLALERIAEYELGGDPNNYGGKVTAADLSPDGNTLAVLTYQGLFLFPRTETHWLAGTPRVIRFAQPLTQQCEAIAWVGEEGLMFSNEARSLFYLDEPMDEDCKVFPGPGCD